MSAKSHAQLKIRPVEMGGHVHVSFFSRTLPTTTWAKNGTLVFDIDEWPHVLGVLPKASELVLWEKYVED